MKLSRGNLQVTPEGYDRYYELVDLLREEPDHPKLIKEFIALQHIILLHPLDYVYPDAVRNYPDWNPQPSQQDLENLVRSDYAKPVESHYNMLISTLKEYDPELLPVFKTYKKLAYAEPVSDYEIDQATIILKRRIEEEEATLAIPGSLTEVWDTSAGESRTRKDRAQILDKIISRIHYDPDLIRKLPKRNQSTVGSAILQWLNQLAGKDN